VTIFKTPFGKPASCANLAKASAVSGVSSAGLITTVQPEHVKNNKNYFSKAKNKTHNKLPAAIAAAAFLVIMA